MPSQEFHIVQNTSRAVQYTGSNSADLIAQAPDLVFVTEDAGSLTMDHLGTEVRILPGQWLRWSPWAVEVLNTYQYTVEWECFTPCGDGQGTTDALAALTARVEALENPSPLLR